MLDFDNFVIRHNFKNNVIMEYITQVKCNYLDSQEMSSYKQSSNLKEDQETMCHPPLIEWCCHLYWAESKQATSQPEG